MAEEHRLSKPPIFCLQAVIDADLIVPLVHMLGEAEFDIKKEAAWAISNATSGGRHDQIKYLVNAGAIKPLCDLLTCSDPRIVTVALEGIENILKACAPPLGPPLSRNSMATSTAA